HRLIAPKGVRDVDGTHRVWSRPSAVRRGQWWTQAAAAMVCACVLVLLVPGVALASTEQLIEVLNNLRNWIVGIAGTLVAVMLTIAGLRYLLASDPGETEKAKTALRAAAIGFAIVILAPAFVAILTA